VEKNLVIDEEVISIVLNYFKDKKIFNIFLYKKINALKNIEIKDGYIRK